MTLSVRPFDPPPSLRARASTPTGPTMLTVLTVGRRRLLTAGLLTLAAVAIFIQFYDIWVPLGEGLDFAPLRDAASAVLHGRSVYTDRLFVYPPTAALPMLPFAAGSVTTAFRLWLAVGIGALIATAIMLARLSPAGLRLLTGAAVTIVLVSGGVAFDSLFLGNMSPVLVPFAVYTLLCFERDQWTRGCVVLVLSLLLKPLLVPLLLLPLVRRQWRALGWSLGPGAVALVVACVFVPGAGRISRVAGFVLGGTNLHGVNAVNNLSLSGLAESAHHPILAVGPAVVVAGFGLFGLVHWTRHSPSRSDGTGAAQMGTAVLLTVFLAGHISEAHFLLVIIATTLLALVLHGDRRRVVLALPGLALLVLPHSFFLGLAHSGVRLQTAYVVAQLLLLAACLSPQLTVAWMARTADRS